MIFMSCKFLPILVKLAVKALRLLNEVWENVSRTCSFLQIFLLLLKPVDSKLLLLPAFKIIAAVIRQYHGLELHGSCGWQWFSWMNSLSFLAGWCHCCCCSWVQSPCSCMSESFPTLQDLVLGSRYSWYSKGRVVVCAWNSPLQTSGKEDEETFAVVETYWDVWKWTPSQLMPCNKKCW